MIKVVLLTLSIAVGGSVAHYYSTHKEAQPAVVTPRGAVISSYNDERDKNDVAQLFKEDWYWLSVNEYRPEDVAYMLDTRSPNSWEPEYTGKMHIDVLREADNKFVGFITYYMYEKTGPFLVGKILFLAVRPEFRGKRYGELLLKHAQQQLFAQGAEVARLVTRVSNEKAQKLYRRAGMKDIGEENGFTHFVVTK